MMDDEPCFFVCLFTQGRVAGGGRQRKKTRPRFQKHR